MHRLSGRFAVGFQDGPNGVKSPAVSGGTPLKRVDGVKIGIVNEGELALGQRNGLHIFGQPAVSLSNSLSSLSAAPFSNTAIDEPDFSATRAFPGDSTIVKSPRRLSLRRIFERSLICMFWGSSPERRLCSLLPPIQEAC